MALLLGDDRANPISREAVSLRAFEKWTARGRPAETSLRDWLEAEQEIRHYQVLASQVQDLQQQLARRVTALRLAQRRLAAEHEVARVLSVSSTLEEAAPQILQSVCEGDGFGLGIFWMFDRATDLLRCKNVFTLPKPGLSVFSDGLNERTLALRVGLPGRVWAVDSAVAMQDAAVSRLYGYDCPELWAGIAFPIKSGVHFLGVLEFYTSDVGPLSGAVVTMMSSIGRQISQFIERRQAEAVVRRQQVEHRVAGRIQQGLLPRDTPLLPGYKIHGRCLSAVEVGGDCFDFLPMTVDGEEYLGVLVADASGHSIAAALLAAETRATLRALAMTSSDVERLLTLVNQRLSDDPERDGFVTALLLRLAADSGAVVYANAGHCPGIVFDRRGGVRASLGSTGFPLGIVSTGNYPLEATLLSENELILLFSDGAYEACSTTNELFGLNRLCGVVRRHWNDSPEAVLDAVFSEIVGFCGGRAVRDDVTVVIIKRSLSQPREDREPK